MPLNIEDQVEQNIAILRLAGTLTLGPSLVSLRNAARTILATPHLVGVILDVNRISSVDSSGLGELTIVYSSANRHNCGMRLVGVSPALHKMLQMTHLDAVLSSSPDIDTAKKQLRSRTESAAR